MRSLAVGPILRVTIAVVCPYLPDASLLSVVRETLRVMRTGTTGMKQPDVPDELDAEKLAEVALGLLSLTIHDGLPRVEGHGLGRHEPIVRARLDPRSSSALDLPCDSLKRRDRGPLDNMQLNPTGDRVMSKRLFLSSALIFACFAVAGCRKPAPPEATKAASPVSGPHATIWVEQDGKIELNGQVADLATVDKALADLAERKGYVMYGRDAASGAPPPNGMQIIQMVVKHRLSVRLSTRRDFSDAVGASGRVIE